MEELLKQILEENKKLVDGQLRIEEENKKLVNGQLRIEKGQLQMEKLQKGMAKDIKAIRDYQHKGLDIDVEKLQGRVKIIEETLKIS